MATLVKVLLNRPQHSSQCNLLSEIKAIVSLILLALRCKCFLSLVILPFQT